jgi:hypothetical protein
MKLERNPTACLLFAYFPMMAKNAELVRIIQVITMK